MALVMPDDGQIFLTNENFKTWLDEFNQDRLNYRMSVEKRLAKLEAKQWIQIGLLAVQLLATAALFMRIG